MPEVMLRCMLVAVEGGLCLLEVPEVLEVMHCVLLCMLEDVEGDLCLLEVLEVMRFWLGTLYAGGAGGYAPCAALYARVNGV